MKMGDQRCITSLILKKYLMIVIFNEIIRLPRISGKCHVFQHKLKIAGESEVVSWWRPFCVYMNVSTIFPLLKKDSINAHETARKK